MLKRPLIAKRLNKMFTILLEDLTVRKVTDYIDTNLILRVSTIVTKGEKRKGKRRKEETIGFVVTFGRPSYKEREFIKQCKKVGESFPIKKLQLTYMPYQRKKVKK